MKRVIFIVFLRKEEVVKCFLKLKSIEISYTSTLKSEVYVARLSPAELFELGFVVLETSLLLLRLLDIQNYKKDMRFWVKRISHNADALPELLWEEGEQSNQLMLRNHNNEHLKLLRYKISRTIQTLFSFEEDSRVPFKLDQIYD